MESGIQKIRHVLGNQIQRTTNSHKADRTSTILQQCTTSVVRAVASESLSATRLVYARRPRENLGVGEHEHYENGQIDPESRRVS
jgi:hypothetical protein